MSEEPLTDKVTVYQDWNERDGKIYFRWRVEGETEWHEKLTAYKEKPYIQYELYTEAEWLIKHGGLQANTKPKSELAKKKKLR